MKLQIATTVKRTFIFYITIILISTLLSSSIMILINSRQFEIVWKPESESHDLMIKGLPLGCLLTLTATFK